MYIFTLSIQKVHTNLAIRNRSTIWHGRMYIITYDNAQCVNDIKCMMVAKRMEQVLNFFKMPNV